MSETKTKQHLPDLTAIRVHHIGISVASLDRALEFWEAFLGVERLWRMMLDRPYLGRHVGYPGVKIDAAFVPLPGGVILELLEYQVEDKVKNPEATANPGNMHICLQVTNAQSAWERAVALGAKPVVPSGPIDIDGGPNKGGRAAYLRIHDGATLEMIQPAPGEKLIMIKRISLVRRKKGMTHEEFLAHWMGPHAEIVRQFPGVRGLRFGAVQRWSPEESAWDGVGEIWFDDIAAAEAAFKTEPHISRLIADREKFLGEAQWCFVEEHTKIAPPQGR